MAQPRTAKRERPKNAKGTLLRILRYTIDSRWTMLGILLLVLIGNALALLGPSLAGKAVGAASAGKGLVDFPLVYRYAGAMLVCYLGSSITTFLVNISMMRMGRLMGKKMRQDVFEKLMALPVSYFDRNQAGDIISRISYDIDVVTTSISTDIVQILTSAVTVSGSLVMMLVISPPLAAITLITIPLAVFYTRYMNRLTRPLFARRSAAYGRMNGFVEEKFSGIRTIQAYDREVQMDEEFAAINREAAEAYEVSTSTARRLGPSVGFINNLSLALVGTVGSLLFLSGHADLEKISSFVLYSRKFSGPISEIANITNEIYSALAAAERVFRLLDQETEAADAENAVPLQNVQGDVKLTDISFGYTEDRMILQDFNLHAEPGQLIAIVGPTGAGKTTVINLLMRFYDTSDGTCLVDGKDMYTLQRESLRRAYAMVLQDTWLFRGTIYENIAYGKENATREEVVAAAKAARIHPYIMQLPQGYDTIISEDGGNISKGQKQLLTIARAMLYNARMLILDEATSNVDTSTERHIQRAMRELMADKTCFVIAHRLSTIRNADKILVVDQGRIQESGTHDELMAKKGAYYKLYAAQFE
ncbi:MAG: ABC transporter ATP-binding protein [Oscillospiraceae bacterium]|nr:ABC transporter ATP-binding protein [Oscillospiraceae bacterium]